VPDPDRGWRLAAPAKLNLWLHLTGRRDDGYHELDTLMVLLDLADELVARTGGEGFEVSGPHAGDVPGDETNLAWRGWDAGWGSVPRGALVLDKQIPAAAGLGGGSSDAAAGWRLARRGAGAADDPPDPSTLEALAGIGADIPFFAAQAGSARVRGIGERVDPAEPPTGAFVVLIHPPFSLSTGAVFAETAASDWSSVDEGAEPGRNDLLAAALRLRPELGDVMRLVTQAGGEPHLTGSGPTVFVLTEDPDRASWVAGMTERGIGLTTTRTRLRSEPASIEPG
jgi:4-diphosphocytidyl-2-C-methyl-D-erythritol kinase